MVNIIWCLKICRILSSTILVTSLTPYIFILAYNKTLIMKKIAVYFILVVKKHL